AVTSSLVPERVEICGALARFRCITLACPPVPGLEDHVAGNGRIGVLLGMPLLATDLDIHVYATVPRAPENDNIGFFPVKLLRPDEYEWAMARGAVGAVDLAEKMLESERPLISIPSRRSVLAYQA